MNERGAGAVGSNGVAVVVGPDYAAIRQTLDPTAWLVREELVLSAGAIGDPVAVGASTSVRALATELGLSKDTVAAALRRLARAGVVRREDERNGGSGQFGHSRYVVDLPATGMRLAGPADDLPGRTSDVAIAQLDHLPTATVNAAARTTRPRPQARNTAASAQLSLLESDQSPA